MTPWRGILVAVGALVTPLLAQSEGTLKRELEGRTVALKIAMPGTENGVDVYPASDRPIDFSRYAERLKEFGTAILPGQIAMITKVRVKSKHIEFHLDGGGYGTAGDATSTTISVTPTPKTKREKNLEAELKRETDPVRKREIQEELDDLQAEREREDARNRVLVADAEERAEQNLRLRRIEGGSRFNIRYRDRIPAEALTTEGIKAALAAYVDFEGPPAPPRQPVEGGLPRKGMLVAEVDDLLGAPADTAERAEGQLKVNTRVYETADGRLTAEFVEGVLFRYSVVSN